MVSFSKHCPVTSASLSAVDPGSAITPEKILESMRSAADSLGPEPIAEAMRRRGFDPERGGVLLIPPQDGLDMDRLPRYVKASGLVSQPMLICTSFADLTAITDWYNMQP